MNRRPADARRSAVPAPGPMRALGCLSIAALALLATLPHAHGQMGQMGMAPAPGVVNQAAAALTNGGGALPGWLYYGVNGADRGLGYRGSYMTLGGFIPYAEDDLGGFWAADLRGHLSTYGGFFSNVGAVRKQFIGGTLLGVGVFWDYDGDQNQYSNTTITDDSGSYVFAGGQSYNQVGVSGEWLTDWGNLRSNGYIPVGTSAGVMGPFVGNSILCQDGINAALGGADLELGAYIPGLADWAGMISVGGYAYGNSRYTLSDGTDVVPWFGGVYTRLDMTFLRGWDFSLQANNDSYFDWTGFARLTYRMGGSRRRNVPDQVEQPMMRNEHIVRTHQAPEQAINPFTGTPWRVLHVDNSTSTTAAGTGTVESPFTNLTDAQAAATTAYDIVFVHVGASRQTPYLTPTDGYTFSADNQYLVGQGTSLAVPTVSCGPVVIGDGSTNKEYPIITNPGGVAVVLTDSADPAVPGTVTNATVDHVQIQGATVGIFDGGGLPANGVATVNDVRIVGTGAAQTGVVILDAAGNAGTFNFTKMQLDDLTADGFYVDGLLGAPRVNISDSRISNTAGSAIYAIDVYGPGRVRVTDSEIDGATGPAIYAESAALSLASSRVSRAPVGVSAIDDSVVQVVSSTFTLVDTGVQAAASNAGTFLSITVNNNDIDTTANTAGIVLSTPSPANTAALNAYVTGNQIRNTGTNTVGIRLSTDAGAPGLLSIKAVSREDLQQLNHNAPVSQVGTPNYDPSLVVPLPTP